MKLRFNYMGVRTSKFLSAKQNKRATF